MPRWTEDRERERWMGGRGGEDERRSRGEEGWRGRDWRDDERSGEWQGGAREWEARERERGLRGGEGEREWRGRGEGQGRYGERGSSGLGWRGEEDRYGPNSGRDASYGLRSYGEGDRDDDRSLGDRMKEGWRKLTGRGPKGYKRSDERIHEEVSERIARSWVNAEEVEVKVENGEVTLTGFVESRQEKRMIEDLADDVFGVDEVHNHLRMRREGRTQSQTFTAGQAQGPTAGMGQSGQTGQRAPQPQQPGPRH
jgi:hypothetical protein